MDKAKGGGTMMSQPRFTSNQNLSRSQSRTSLTSEFHDSVNFDLLAEYLLDDDAHNADSSSMTFFGQVQGIPEVQPSSGASSTEGDDVGFSGLFGANAPSDYGMEDPNSPVMGAEGDPKSDMVAMPDLGPKETNNNSSAKAGPGATTAKKGRGQGKRKKSKDDSKPASGGGGQKTKSQAQVRISSARRRPVAARRGSFFPLSWTCFSIESRFIKLGASLFLLHLPAPSEGLERTLLHPSRCAPRASELTIERVCRCLLRRSLLCTQVDRRRERNRILARRTRLRKKFFFENLQAEVASLQTLNKQLKEIVARKMPKSISESVLKECTAELPKCVLEDINIGNACLEDMKFAHNLRTAQSVFCISDPSLPDSPIVYCSQGFCDLTGYELAEVLGRNCRFLQGPGTSLEKVKKIREGISGGSDVSVTLLNYKKDGTSFWNSLFIASLMDSSGNIVNHISVQTEVQGPPPGDPEFESFKASNVDQGEVDDSFL